MSILLESDQAMSGHKSKGGIGDAYKFGTLRNYENEKTWKIPIFEIGKLL